MCKPPTGLVDSCDLSSSSSGNIKTNCDAMSACSWNRQLDYCYLMDPCLCNLSVADTYLYLYPRGLTLSYISVTTSTLTITIPNSYFK